MSSEQALDDAVAEFDAAQGAVDESQTRLLKTRIRAPFDGMLGLRQVNQGQYLESGTPVVEITQVDPLELEFGLPQRYAAELEVGQVVLGTVDQCGQRFEARVDAIDPRVDPGTRAVRLQAMVPNENGEAPAGDGRPRPARRRHASGRGRDSPGGDHPPGNEAPGVRPR